jgi:hypothetical protein
MKRGLLLALLLIAVDARADFNADARGTTTASFLKLGVGARAVGMGEAYAAVADDATALYWNPAGLARVGKHSAAFMHAPYLASTFYDYGAYAYRAGAHGFGAGVQYFSAGRMDQTDVNNTALGSFHPHDVAASLGYAYGFSDEGAALGIAAKFIQSKIIESASAAAVDVGLQSRVYADRFRLALTATNIGTKMKFEQDSESLPLALRAGSALKLTERWLSSLDIAFPKDNEPYAAIGTEYGWRAGETFTLIGRAGYNSRTSGDISGVTGFSLGLGFSFPRAALDYAFLPYGGLGLTHRISLSFKWGSSESSPTLLSSSSPDQLDEILKN